MGAASVKSTDVLSGISFRDPDRADDLGRGERPSKGKLASALSLSESALVRPLGYKTDHFVRIKHLTSVSVLHLCTGVHCEWSLSPSTSKLRLG